MKGKLSEISLADLVTLHCQNSNSALLRINNGADNAELFFENGRIKHATAKDLEGEKAVYEALRWSEGYFDLIVDTASDVQSINRSWPSLLLEGARLFDEESPAEADISKVKTSGRISVEAHLLNLSAELPGFVGAAFLGLDGREKASFFPVSPEDRTKLFDDANNFLRDIRKAIDKSQIGQFEDEILSGENGSVLIALYETRQSFLFAKTSHEPAERGSSMDQLRAISKKYRQLMKTSLFSRIPEIEDHVAHIFVDVEGVVRFASRKLFAITGQRTLKEVIGKPMHKSVEASTEDVQSFYSELANKGVIQRRIFPIFGGMGHISITGIATYDHTGKMFGANVYVRPIKIEDLMSLPMDERTYNEEMPVYVTHHLEGIFELLEREGGASLITPLRMDLNETAERGAWSVHIESGSIEIGNDAEIDVYISILAKAFIYCNQAVGKNKVAKRIQKQNSAYGENADYLENALGVTNLLLNV